MTKEQLQNIRVTCNCLSEGFKVGTGVVIQLLDWIDELERHAEADAANAKHMRSQLAESQAREAQLRAALEQSCKCIYGHTMQDDWSLKTSLTEECAACKSLSSTREIRERIGAT